MQILTIKLGITLLMEATVLSVHSREAHHTAIAIRRDFGTLDQ
jgi:hypothetical protein